MSDYVTHGELDAAIADIREELGDRIGTVEEELAVAKADIANSDRWYAHMDKRMDKQDERLSSIYRVSGGALISLLIWLIYYATTHH